jgi:hypothetical protein
LQQFFRGVGSISKRKTGNVVVYTINGIQDLTNILIPHIEKYPLLTKKAADFFLFKQVVELIKNKKHLTIEGIFKIINIKASMNLGLSELIKSNFSNLKAVKIPIILTNKIPNAKWVSGFTTGEGNFDVMISKSKSHSIGYRVQLRFRIYQHERDIKLMELLIKYLGSGKIERSIDHNKSTVSLIIVKLSDINKKIIPLFDANPLYGVKHLDYIDFCKVAKLMNEGKHLTIEGLELISKIKAGMNTKRQI